jgi:hypothetical protein
MLLSAMGSTLILTQLSVLATYPQIIGYDQDVYNYFKEQLVLSSYFSPSRVLNEICTPLAGLIYVVSI